MAALALEKDLDDQDPAAEETPAPVTPQSKKKKKKKGQRKSGKKGANPDKPKPASKKCTGCGKTKPCDEFHADQLKCKPCSAGSRSMLRAAESQGCKPMVLKLRTESPDADEAMEKAFNKERADQQKAGKKIKFSFVTFVREWQKREGFRGSEIGEFMWEQEYYEFAASAKCGYLSKPEREAAREAMLKEDWRPRDNNGPRGFLRLWIKTKDTGENFSEVSAAKIFAQQESLKKPTQAQVQSRVQMVFSDAADAETGGYAGDFDFERLKGEARRASPGSAPMEGVMQPSIGAMVQSAQTQAEAKRKSKSALAKASAQAEEYSDDEYSDDDAGEDRDAAELSQASGGDQGVPEPKKRANVAGVVVPMPQVRLGMMLNQRT